MLILCIIYRTVELSDEVERLRPPRRFYSDKVIRPYRLFEATGNAILHVNITFKNSIMLFDANVA